MLVVEVVLCAIGVVAALVVALSFGRLPWDEHIGEIVGTFGLIVLLFAVYIRIWWAQDRLEAKTRLMWFLPAVVAAILAPSVLAADGSGGNPPVVDVLLLVLAAYGAALLGFLALIFVLAPLEMLGRGILRLVTGRPDGGWLLFGGALVGLVTIFGVVGAFALDDIPSGRAAMIPVLCALLGIPYGYTVESEVLLWVARGLALLLIAMLLAASHFGARRRERAVAATAVEHEDDRRRRSARREAQIARDREARQRREDG